MSLKDEVLEVLRYSERPLGAYEILAALEAQRGRLAPTSVYRALDALIGSGHVHRVESMNAFVFCRSARCREQRTEGTVLSICDRCGAVEEQVDDALRRSLGAITKRSGFRAARHVVEIRGQCGTCVAEAAR